MDLRPAIANATGSTPQARPLEELLMTSSEMRLEALASTEADRTGLLLAELQFSAEYQGPQGRLRHRTDFSPAIPFLTTYGQGEGIVDYNSFLVGEVVFDDFNPIKSKTHCRALTAITEPFQQAVGDAPQLRPVQPRLLLPNKLPWTFFNPQMLPSRQPHLHWLLQPQRQHQHLEIL